MSFSTRCWRLSDETCEEITAEEFEDAAAGVSMHRKDLEILLSLNSLKGELQEQIATWPTAAQIAYCQYYWDERRQQPVLEWTDPQPAPIAETSAIHPPTRPDTP
jgi:hypothetical protein